MSGNYELACHVVELGMRRTIRVGREVIAGARLDVVVKKRLASPSLDRLRQEAHGLRSE